MSDFTENIKRLVAEEVQKVLKNERDERSSEVPSRSQPGGSGTTEQRSEVRSGVAWTSCGGSGKQKRLGQVANRLTTLVTTINKKAESKNGVKKDLKITVTSYIYNIQKSYLKSCTLGQPPNIC